MIRKIYVYTCLRSTNELSTIRHTLISRVRNRFRKIYDYFIWKMGWGWSFRPWTYAKRDNSNKGDIGIRLAVRQALNKFVVTAETEIIEVGWGDLNTSLVEEINRDGSAFIIGGSGYIFFHHVKGELNERISQDIPHIISINCPVIALSVGVNFISSEISPESLQPLNLQAAALLRLFINHLALFSVRDASILETCASLALPPPEVIADPVLFLEPAHHQVPAPTRRRIGINFGFHGPSSNGLLQQKIYIYIEALRKIRKKFDCEFVYFLHSDSEQLVVNLLLWSGIDLTIVNESPERMLDWYATLDIHICQMLHSSIMSTSVGIPTINLSYDIKNLAFFKMMGIENYCTPAANTTTEHLLELVDQLLANRREIAQHLRARKQELEATFNSFCSRLSHLIPAVPAPAVEPAAQRPVMTENIPPSSCDVSQNVDPTAIDRAKVSQKLVSGSIWMVGMRWATRCIGLVSTILLAHLLAPENFGIVAKAMIIVGFLEILTDTGQRLALIRHPAPTREHYDSAWSVSILIGLGVGITILLIAPFSNSYLHDNNAALLVAILSARVFIAAFENIGTVNFRRDMDFATEFKYGVYKKLTAFSITISFAFLLRNYWALVIGIIGGQACFIIISYIIHPYRPRWCLTKVRELWSFSIWTMVNSVGGYLQRTLDQMMVAGVADSRNMAFYAVGSEIASLPTIEMVDPIARGLYPVYAKLSQHPEELRVAYLDVLGMITIICASASVIVALIATDLVQIILGNQWHDAAPFIACLAIASGVGGISISVNTVLTAAGEPRRVAIQSWARLFLALPCFFLGMYLDGTMGITYAMLIVALIMTPSYFYQLIRVVPITVGQLIKTTWRPLVAAGIMAAVFLHIPFLSLVDSLPLRLLAEITVCAIGFAISLLALWMLSGRPPGAERSLIGFVRTGFGKG